VTCSIRTYAMSISDYSSKSSNEPRPISRLASANRYTVVVVTHELNLAGQYADQVALFQKGKCLRVGPPAAVFRRELLEQVFQTPLTVELGSSGRPRVNMPSAK